MYTPQYGDVTVGRDDNTSFVLRVVLEKVRGGYLLGSRMCTMNLLVSDVGISKVGNVGLMVVLQELLNTEVKKAKKQTEGKNKTKGLHAS